MKDTEVSGQAAPVVIGDRYRVEQRLGRGGMAEVYRVYDSSTQRILGLKRLCPSERPELATHVVQLFEHEFHTLSQLVHPRIIEAYDYHRDESGPYYTMELLDGGDLRELAPLPWRRVATLLSDVCSALSLLHSRRLLHRDLTPLNIRCTRDGNAKLFDFGSMAHTGISKHVVGTPPFVAPEALAGQVLDARTDLFALGATAYFTLTGRHAFPARSLSALAELWRKPLVPASHHVPDLPPAFDDLITSLLQLDPKHRPATAAEVMERLSAIAGCSLDESLLVQRAYLVTPNLLGRDAALDRARKHLARATRNKGGVLIIQGPASVGRSRFLDACALEAKLSGALLLRCDARDASAGRWGATHALLQQLVSEAPELALKCLLPHSPLLDHVLPDFVRTLDGMRLERGSLPAPEVSETPGPAELRAAVQTALRGALCEVADQRLLLIAVDDATRLDEPSAALLALLAQETRKRPLLIFATAQDEERDAADNKAVTLLLSRGTAIRLTPFTHEQTQQLILSLFGDVPNVRLLADRLHSAAGGSPGVIMQLTQQLLDRGVVRYGAGAWILPSGFDVSALPSSLSEHFAAMIRELSDSTKALAEAIALCSVRSVSADECVLIAVHEDRQRVMQDLDELLACGILMRKDGRHFFSRPLFERMVREQTAAEREPDLHRRAAVLFDRRGNEQFRTATHLLHSGEPALALDLLVHHLDSTRDTRIQDPTALFEYVQSLPQQWPETFRALIAACDALGRPKRDRFVLQVNLVAYSTYTGRSEPGYLRDVAAQLAHDAGLDLYAALTQEPADTRLTTALTQAAARHQASPEHDRVLSPAVAIPRLAQLLLQAVSLATRCMDRELLASMPSLQPLFPLSPALAVVQRDVDASLLLLEGRIEAARQTYLQLLARIEEPDHAGLEGMYYTHLRLAIMMAVGQVELSRGLPSTEQWAPALEDNPLFAVTAWRMRQQAALILGDLRQAEQHRSAAERLQIQNCPVQLFEGLHLWPEVIAHADAEDLLRVKQGAVEIERIAAQHRGWQPCLHFARGAYQALRGDNQRALEEFEHALALAELGRHMSWAITANRVLQLLNRQARFEETVARGNAMLVTMKQQGMADNGYALMTQLALAEAALGDHTNALLHAEAAISDLEMRGARGIALGAAYEARARVAMHAKDTEAFERYAQLCDEQYRIGQNAALVARTQRLLRDAVDAGVSTAPVFEVSPPPDPDEWGSSLATLLSTCQRPDERAERALTLIAEHSQLQGGYLYTLQQHGPVLVATHGAAPPPAHLDEMVASYLAKVSAVQTDMEATTVQASPRRRDADTRGRGWAGYVPMLLSHEHENDRAVIGLAVMLAPPRGHTQRVPHRLLSALSKTLLETGDVMATTEGVWRSRLAQQPVGPSEPPPA
jgi:hypothetical protein